MSGKPGYRNLAGMRGRRKGGLQPLSSPKPPPRSIAALSDAFLHHLSSLAYSHKTLACHRIALTQFIRWANTRPDPSPRAFSRPDLEEFQLFLHRYISPRSGKTLAINTQISRLGCIRRFFAWLCRSGAIPANPAADLDLPRKQSRTIPKSLSQHEISLILAHPNPADTFGLRDRSILELFYASGLRRSEMADLDLGDYDPQALTILVRKGKNGKSRLLPIGPRAASWLNHYIATSRPNFDFIPGETALFLTGYGTRISSAYLGAWFKKILRACGITKPGSCHLFRHSCATDMHRGGADIRYVQEMLGHARLETTQIYTHVRIGVLREIHANTHPHGRINPADPYATPHLRPSPSPSAAATPVNPSPFPGHPYPENPLKPGIPARSSHLRIPSPPFPPHLAGDSSMNLSLAGSAQNHPKRKTPQFLIHSLANQFLMH